MIESENPAAVAMRGDLQIIAERAHGVCCRGGGAAYNAYILDLMQAGDRHVNTEPTEITEGFWWARRKADGKLTVIEVSLRDWVEPDEDDYGVLWGVVLGRDYDERVSDGLRGHHGLDHYYEFISKIQEPA